MHAHEANIGVQTQGSRAFRHFAGGNRAAMDESDGVSAIRNVEAVQSNSCATLCSLIKNVNEESILWLKAGETVERLVDSLNNHPSSAAIQENACGALSALLARLPL